MEKNPKIVILYRMAEKRNKTDKKKPFYINNENCLHNIFNTKGNSRIIVFGDRLNESEELAKLYSDKYIETTAHGNCPTFLEVMNYALRLDDKQIVYFVEDDYLHKRNWPKIIKEGLEKADFVSLYDHPDKYQYEQSNELFLTKSSHWKYTNSTTMTFATTVKTLKFVSDIFVRNCQGNIPKDYYLWNELWQRNYSLATPIPGYSTHGETKFLSPFFNWETL